MRKIGFWSENEQSKEQKNETAQFKAEKTEAKESVVRVYFPARGFACSYYNDKFDLKKGDGVYVDGKLEGLLGFITEVSYCFKIRLSEYKRVIYRVDTEIRGKLYLLGDFFAAFDEDVIPKEKILPWFVRPDNEDDVARSYGEGTEAELSDSEFTCDKLPLITHSNKTLLICVVNRHQIVAFQRIIQQFPGSFAYLSSVKETMGNFAHIKR